MSEQLKGYVVLGFVVALALARVIPALNIPVLIAVCCLALWIVVAWIVKLINPKKPFRAKYQPSKSYYAKYGKPVEYRKTGADLTNDELKHSNKLPDDFEPTLTINKFKVSHLELKLRQLVKDNYAVDRLLASAKSKYPDKTYDWQVDKVLSDWLRDRQ